MLKEGMGNKITTKSRKGQKVQERPSSVPTQPEVSSKVEGGEEHEEQEEKEKVITKPTPSFKVDKLVDFMKFTKHFARCKICKMLYVNLNTLFEVIKLDLS